MDMNGYWGRVLVVDLSEETAQELPLPEEWLRAYVGCEGLAVRLFRYMADPMVPAAEADNPVVFAAGPLTGAPLDGCDRGAAVFRMPDGAGIGTVRLEGAFPVALKKSGFDAIVVMGASEDPSLLSVDDEDGAQVVDAADLWNSDAEETEDAVSGTLEGDGYGIFAIGDAEGEEELSPFESVLAEKRLKAVVVQGTAEPEFADPKAMKRLGDADAGEEDVAFPWTTGAAGNPDVRMAGILSAALGRPFPEEELKAAAERVSTLSRAVDAAFGNDADAEPIPAETLLRLRLEWLL